MNSQVVSRDSLLDDLRFWCLLYEPWLKPCVGDPFREGEEYFFSIREHAVYDLFHELEAIPVDEENFPAVAVLVSLANRWRAGVDLMMCPEDFEFDYVVVPPSSDEHKILGVHGGNHCLPALRWEEVLLLADAIRPTTPLSRAKGILLFYPASFPGESQRAEVKEVLRQAWGAFGFQVRHLDELIDRTDRSGRGLAWKRDPKFGWVCEAESSLRNLRWAQQRHPRSTPGMLSAVAELFSSL